MTQLFAVLHEASQMPGYNNNLKYEDGLNIFPPNLGPVRQTTRLLIINAELTAQNGNTEKAWATVLEALKLVDLLQQEPILVTQLTRVACDRAIIDCMERMANKTDIPADQARTIIAELAHHTDTTPWIRAMDFDRMMMGTLYFQIIQYGSFTNCNTRVFTEMNIRRRLYRAFGFPMLGLLKRDCSVYLKLMSQIQDHYKVPYWEAAETIRNHPLDQQIPRFCTWTRSTLTGSEYGLVACKATHDAAIAVARVGLGLKLFKQKNGAYPETLDNLAPEFIDAIPLDPFTGKALIYRKAEAGFILYSLGPNQRDDNGTPRPTGKNVTGKEPYDIVWQCAK
ncbi:MAG: hypothetical protein WC130_03285 [Kiritimatiellia bacterium]